MPIIDSNLCKAKSLTQVWAERDLAGPKVHEFVTIYIRETDRRFFEKHMGYAVSTNEIQAILTAIMRGNVELK